MFWCPWPCFSRSVTPVLTLGRDWAGDYLVREFADAGADTRYISRRADVASPILAQRLNLESGHHWFSFICPETKAELPRYTSIEAADVSHAHDVISRCSVFYSDRVSDTIVEAMESAAEAGALIYFEPSSIENDKLFERALKVSRILKYSSDCLADRISASDLSANAISIVTHGASGLECVKATSGFGVRPCRPQSCETLVDQAIWSAWASSTGSWIDQTSRRRIGH